MRNQPRSGEACCPSREAAQEFSPGRQPWVSMCNVSQPWKGGRTAFCRPSRAHVPANFNPGLAPWAKLLRRFAAMGSKA